MKWTPGTAVLMRYRFETLDQLARHLHLVDEAALMFLRDHREKFAVGERLLVELSIRASGLQTAARGEVVARAEGALRGSWLQLADTRLARTVGDPAAFAVQREGRISASSMVQLRADSGAQLVAEMMDVGPGGLRIRGSAGLGQGDWCAVRVLGLPTLAADLGRAQVVRTEGIEAGLRFAAPGTPPVARLIRSLQEAWRRAPELDHPTNCCGEHGPLEPALPRLR